jgi:hypothetical protein
MSVCATCGHSPAEHDECDWLGLDADWRPCLDPYCSCDEYVSGLACAHRNTSGLQPDDSVQCLDCGVLFVADG